MFGETFHNAFPKISGTELKLINSSLETIRAKKSKLNLTGDGQITRTLSDNDLKIIADIIIDIGLLLHQDFEEKLNNYISVEWKHGEEYINNGKITVLLPTISFCLLGTENVVEGLMEHFLTDPYSTNIPLVLHDSDRFTTINEDLIYQIAENYANSFDSSANRYDMITDVLINYTKYNAVFLIAKFTFNGFVKLIISLEEYDNKTHYALQDIFKLYNDEINTLINDKIRSICDESLRNYIFKD